MLLLACRTVDRTQDWRVATSPARYRRQSSSTGTQIGLRFTILSSFIGITPIVLSEMYLVISTGYLHFSVDGAGGVGDSLSIG
jgi:hypothetical protein